MEIGGTEMNTTGQSVELTPTPNKAVLKVYLYPDEKLAVRQAAREARLSDTEYARRKLLGKHL